MRKALLALALLTGGCAVWDKPNSTEEEFDRDEYECQLAASGNSGIAGAGTIYRGVAMGYATPTPSRTIYKACMRSKGWKQTNTIG